MAEMTPDELKRLCAGLHYLAALVDRARADAPVLLVPTPPEQPKPAPVEPTPDPVEPEQPKPDPVVVGSSMVKVPGQAENRFKYNANASSNMAVYRDASGKLRQVLVYYNKDRQTCIVRRTFPSGEFEAPINIHAKLGNTATLEYDNHNVAAVGVAPDGTIFACSNMHVDPLRMAVTKRAYDLHSFEPFDRREMGQTDTDRVTYPSFFYHQGFLCFSYREQEVGGGDPRFRWILKKYKHGSGQWETMVVFNKGSHLRLYVSNIATSHDGERIHCAALWRDDTVSRPGTTSQHDYFHMYSDNGRDWFQYAKSGAVRVPLPVTWIGDTASRVPEKIWNTPPDPIPNGAGSIAIDDIGFPHMLMDIRRGPLVYHRFDNGTWEWRENRGLLDTADDDIFTIGSRVCAVSHTGNSVYFHEFEGNATPSTVLLASGYVGSNFNVHVDRTALLQGWLSVMLTTNESHSPRSTEAPLATDMYVMSISLNKLATYSTPFQTS